MPITNKEVVSVLYEKIDEKKHKCKACQTQITQDPKAGYKNLISHLERHKEYEEVAHEIIDSKGSKTLTLDMFLDTNASITYEWMKLIIMENMALKSLDSENVCHAVRWDPISSKTFKKRLFKINEEMESLNKRQATLFNI